MKKKILALLLCSVMTASLAACGGSDNGGSESGGQSSAEASSPAGGEEAGGGESEAAGGEEAGGLVFELAAPEALPDTPFAHYTFDEGAGEAYTIVERDENNPGALDGATHGIKESADTLGYADGPVGQAIYLDGKHGLDLNLEATNTDAYTVSFWVNGDRFGTYGPTLCMGYNIGRAADAGNNVTWFNITQAEWGADSAKIFPIVWSRNEASDAQDGTDCWPWMYSWDDAVHGKNEWVMVTLVASGEVLEAKQGTDSVGNAFTTRTTCGAQFYVNGVKMYDSADNYNNNTYFEYTWDASLAPNIMKPDGAEFESWFGINYWDVIFKGFVDDLYVYDTALTPGQVASLYALGDPSVQSVAPELPEGGEEEPEPAEPTVPDHSAVVTTGTVVGATDCSTAFWTEFSDTVAVPSGESVTVNFTNYTSTINNWENFLVILQNVPDAHATDANADYKEYAVLRADNFGWGTGYDGIVTPECDWNWDTFKTDMDGAAVELTITNNGETADVVAVVTTAAGTVYNQAYKGIAIDGDLYYCLSVEKAFLDIQQ